MSKNTKKASGFQLLLHTLKRVIQRDETYIEKVSAYDENADYIKIRHNGTTDYGNIVYVIKENCDHDGFCATIRFIICYLLYAQEHGFAPKIVLTEKFVYYDEEKSREISNPWEYYFLPVGDMYDEKSALNVCYGEYHQMQTIRELYDLNAYRTGNYTDERILSVCSPIVKKYLVLKPEITGEATDIIKKVKENGGKILGVHYRGTDYKQGYHNHPVFIDADRMITEIKNAIDTGEYKAVFLATDDLSVCEKIRNSIGSTELLMFSDVFRSDGDKSVAFTESSRKFHHYLLGYEIARDMYTLSLCDGLLAVKSSVGFLSNLFKHSRNEEYGYMRILDEGNYDSEKYFTARP